MDANCFENGGKKLRFQANTVTCGQYLRGLKNLGPCSQSEHSVTKSSQNNKLKNRNENLIKKSALTNFFLYSSTSSVEKLPPSENTLKIKSYVHLLTGT